MLVSTQTALILVTTASPPRQHLSLTGGEFMSRFEQVKFGGWARGPFERIFTCKVPTHVTQRVSCWVVLISGPGEEERCVWEPRCRSGPLVVNRSASIRALCAPICNN